MPLIVGVAIQNGRAENGRIGCVLHNKAQPVRIGLASISPSNACCRARISRLLRESASEWPGHMPLAAQRVTFSQESAMSIASVNQYSVYRFSAETTDGEGTMKAQLGGKGAGLAEMARLGIPIPPGFTIPT